MMNNKIHHEFLYNFKQVSEIVTIDIPNNKNCMTKEDLKRIANDVGVKSEVSNSIEDAIKYISNKDKESIILIIGSIFLIGEVLNLN